MNAGFWLAALFLVALSWSVLWASQRRAAGAEPVPERTNVGLLDEQLQALCDDHRRGQIDAVQLRRGQAEIERRLLAESTGMHGLPDGGTADAADVRDASDFPAASRGSRAPRRGLRASLVSDTSRTFGTSGTSGTSGMSGMCGMSGTSDTNRTFRPSRTLAALAVVLPAVAAGGYLLLGNPAAATLPAAAVVDPGSPASSADVQAMVDTLAQRLRTRPPGQADDLAGWTMLARSLAALQRFDEAAAAFDRALALAPNDASLLADLADVLAMRGALGGAVGAAGAVGAVGAARDGGDIGGVGGVGADRSARLVARALELDPTNLKALALAGNTAFERHDPAAAVGFWRRARALAPAGSDFAAGLDQNLAEAGVAPTAPTASTASIHGVLRIDPALAARIAPGDTVFIFARAAGGPPMPLAVLRRTAAELPIDFTLDDSTAMSPERRLSQAGPLVVGARVSRSGQAQPQPGDLIGQVDAALGGPALSITLDHVQP